MMLHEVIQDIHGLDAELVSLDISFVALSRNWL